MEYREFIDYIGTLDFVQDNETADAMVKAVLGILCSSVDEPIAHQLTENLPEPLTVETLRSHQLRKEQPTLDNYVQEIRTQFGISDSQAVDVVDHVVRITRDAAGAETWNRFTEHLPAELGQAIRKP
jgi:uncharacterized protein (DUF2267 family)